MPDDLSGQTTHPAPPQSEPERLNRLRLIRSRRVGPATFHRLMLEHGSAAAALAALPEIAEAAGVTGYVPCPGETAEREMTAARRIGARMVCLGEDDYPAPLLGLADAPPVLWLRGGRPELLQRPMVALVGARNASSLGTRMARKLAGELSEAGFAIVSGLARGIDAAAHHAALPRGTVAVLAGGVDIVYPVENLSLADRIFATGVALSEQPIGMQPLARHFPVRNRIISGLARGVVVVEAALKSGSLITARGALDQGREVLAVPGHPIDARASGCNALIRDGATLTRNAQDVIDALAPLNQTPPPTPPPTTTPTPPPTTTPTTTTPAPDAVVRSGSGPADDLQRKILNQLGPTPVAIDQLIRDLGLPARLVSPELTTLELEGRIEKRAGGLVSLAQG